MKTSTPILLKRGNKEYVLFYIVLEDDGSVYITFPSKKGRYISKSDIKEYEQKDYSECIRNLNNYDKANIEPKVSFHPRDMIVHVNSNKTKGISDNYKMLNVCPIYDKIFVYLLQIIFPNDINFYDEYNKKKHPDYIVIDYEPINDILSIELIIHSSDIMPTKESLPFSKSRVFRFGYTYNSGKKYTYSIFVSTISGSNNDSILMCLNTKDVSCLYTINNKNN